MVRPPPRSTRTAPRVPYTPLFRSELFWRTWCVGIGLSLLGVLLLLYSLGGPAFTGIGVWGTTIPYVWGFDLASYAWWIGIANGAALFAAILVDRKSTRLNSSH